MSTCEENGAVYLIEHNRNLGTCVTTVFKYLQGWDGEETTFKIVWTSSGIPITEHV